VKITIERAIEILDPEHRERYSDLPDGMEQLNEACRMGMEALQKQLPVNPKVSGGLYSCPVCGQFLKVGGNCGRCEQKIDWRKAN